MIGWSFSYFASLDEEAYLKSRTKLFDFAQLAHTDYELDSSKGISNLIWTLSMNIYAASRVENKEDYHHYLKILKTLITQTSLAQVLSYVPQDDYPQWLISLLRLSFLRMKDEENLKLLGKLPNTFKVCNLDTMLALAYRILADNLL